MKELKLDSWWIGLIAFALVLRLILHIYFFVIQKIAASTHNQNQIVWERGTLII